MNEPKPITGPGIFWAINQIHEHFDQQIAKCAPKVKQEDVALRAEKEASTELNPTGQN